MATLTLGTVELEDATTTLTVGLVEVTDPDVASLTVGGVEVSDVVVEIPDTGQWLYAEGAWRPVDLWVFVPDSGTYSSGPYGSGTYGGSP